MREDGGKRRRIRCVRGNEGEREGKMGDAEGK